MLNREAKDAEVQSALQVFEQIMLDQAAITNALAKYERDSEQILAAREKERTDNIDLARKNLEAYEAKIAEREAQLDKERELKIAGAEKVFNEYVAKLPERLAQWEPTACTPPSGKHSTPRRSRRPRIPS